MNWFVEAVEAFAGVHVSAYVSRRRQTARATYGRPPVSREAASKSVRAPGRMEPHA